MKTIRTGISMKKWRIMENRSQNYCSFFNYPENNAYILPFLQQNMVFKRWMTWHYPTNIGHSKLNFTRSQHSILFCSKTKKNND